jgi:cytoskeleton protein RodZ
MARKTKESKLEPNQAVELIEENAEQSGEDYGVHSRSRCGGALRTVRENQGLSIQDIASRLRLGPKQIEALEADNFTALPEPTIVRGFIRNYAKQLKISAEPLLDAYNVIVPNTEMHGLIVRPGTSMKMTSHKKPKPGRYLWAGLAVLTGLGVWLFYHNYVEKPSPTALSETAIGSENAVGDGSSEPLPEVALPVAERDTALQPSTELTLPAPAVPADTGVSNATPTNTDLPATTVLPATTMPDQSAVSAQPIAPAVSTPVAPVTVASALGGIAKLEFNASQETWVSVVDASGREIYNKIIFAGSRDSIDVTPPVNVTVGNAGATNFSMNGKPVELAPHMRGNVARLKLE